MPLLKHELAIDLGTANTVIYQNDKVVLDEPSIVAINSRTGALMAIGRAAQLMEGRENPGIQTVRPLVSGVIADFNAAELMIKGFIQKASGEGLNFRSMIFDVVKDLPDEEIVRLLRAGTENPARALVDAALSGGGTDNVTAVVVSLL